MKHEKRMGKSRFCSKNATLQLVGVICKIMDRRDPYTYSHSKNVAALSVMIGEQLKLQDDELHGLRIAAMLHDIGKIVIPAEILFKPSCLNDIEWEFVRIHPVTGYEFLKDVDFPWPVAKAVLQHHERIDGSGYPFRLKGNEILLYARIIAVADVVDAITSHRPYRPALTTEAAINELRINRGIKYDAEVVDACLHILRTSTWKKRVKPIRASKPLE